MAPSPPPGGGGQALKRSMEIAIGSTTLPLAAIIGIAVGGAVVLFAILVTIAITLVRKKHPLEKRQSEKARGKDGEMDLRTAIRSTRPPELSFSRRLSFNPFLPLNQDGIESRDWVAHELSQNNLRSKRRSIHSRFFPHRARDSWPLLSNIPLALLPGPSNLQQSQVAPPGYLVEAPKWPKRSSSKRSSQRNSRTSGKGSLTSITRAETPQSPEIDLPIPVKSLQRQRIPHRRSTSENQLSTILRSTSQRLKEAHRRSLSRTMSVIGRYPGSPPSEGLPPTPPRATESREELIARFSQSISDSINNSSRNRISSPNTEILRKTSQQARSVSPTPSGDSRDSLCATKTPDLVIPASLTSPSKRGSRGEKRHKMRISSAGAKDLSMTIHDDTRASLNAIGRHASVDNKILAMPQRISLAGDPFCSSVRSAKPMIPNSEVHGLKTAPPLYIRKATFGQEATPERPQSFCSTSGSPLKVVSGNAQASSKPPQLDPNAPNPFQWSPQESMQTRATQTSPTHKRTGSPRRRGHKRSNVIRMSNLPRPSSTRPPSSVDVVPEESDEESPLRLESPKQPAIRRLEPRKDTSCSTSSSSLTSRSLSTRPPSSAVFNPSLLGPGLVSRSEDNSPTLGQEDITNGTSYSPTLSVCNYYTENCGASEDEFFNPANPSPSASESVLKERHHRRNYSTDLPIYPTHQQQKDGQALVSFPSPSLSKTTTPILSPPPSRPLPSIDFSLTGVGITLPSTAPPLLTLSTPSHLTGPRAEPQKHRLDFSGSPPRNSVATSIGILRRMNSEVSHYSGSASPMDSRGNSSENSPTLPEYRHSLLSREDEERDRERGRGSKYYLSLGSNLAPKASSTSSKNLPNSGVEAGGEMGVRNQQKKVVRDSYRVYAERRKRRNEELDEEGRDLTPVREVSSPATGANALGITGLRFPTLSREGRNVVTPPRETRSPDKISGLDSRVPEESVQTSRWSSATSKPSPAHCVVRRESAMEHPSPQTPPNWGANLALGPAGQRGSPTECEERRGRPDSLGLYDSDGFLKCSPDREAARLKEERRREERDLKRLSGFVM